MSGKPESGAAQELYYHMHYGNNWSFNGSLILQQICDLCNVASHLLMKKLLGVHMIPPLIVLYKAHIGQLLMDYGMYEHNITQENSQLISGLGVEVFKVFKEEFRFEDKYLLKMIQIFHVFVWLDYLRWKFKLFPTVLRNVESVDWIYDIQVVEKLVEHEWRTTKLQQNFRLKLHVVPSQHCNPSLAKGNVQALTEVVINVILVSLIHKLVVELAKNLKDSRRHVEMSGVLTSVGVIRIQTGIFEQLTCLRGCSQLLGFFVRHKWRYKTRGTKLEPQVITEIFIPLRSDRMAEVEEGICQQLQIYMPGPLELMKNRKLAFKCVTPSYFLEARQVVEKLHPLFTEIKLVLTLIQHPDTLLLVVFLKLKF